MEEFFKKITEILDYIIFYALDPESPEFAAIRIKLANLEVDIREYYKKGE